MCAGGGLDVPFDQLETQGIRNLPGKLGLAGSGLALDQQRALERDRRIHRDHQVFRRYVILRSLETHIPRPCPDALP